MNGWHRVRILSHDVPIMAYTVGGVVEKLQFTQSTGRMVEDHIHLGKDRLMATFVHHLMIKLKQVYISEEGQHLGYFVHFLRHYHSHATLGMIDFIFENDITMTEIATINLFPCYSVTAQWMSYPTVLKCLNLGLSGLCYLKLNDVNWEEGPYIHLLTHLSDRAETRFNPLNQTTGIPIICVQKKQDAEFISSKVSRKLDIRYLED